MQAWLTRARRVILKHSKFLTVEEHDVQLPSGQVIENWAWIITPDYINVVAVTQDDLFLCFRQVKYAVEGVSFAPVGGYLEPGEDPLNAAKRELLEETGCTASEWVSLGNYAVDGNRGAGRAHLFLALNATPTAEIRADDLEEQELVRLSRAEVESALANGEFKVLAWAANIALALNYLARTNQAL
jgi:ADP-ribose pyrophosphatase